MPIRYSDMDLSDSGAKDFVVRKRAPTIMQMLLIFASVLVVSVSVTVSVIDRMALVTILLIMMGAVGWYVIVQLQRGRDLVLATEFQNALFASALGINNKFCLIIKRDGNIVYLDRAFQQMFPEFLKITHRTVDNLLQYGKVQPDDKRKIFNAIERDVFDKVIFEIRGSDNHFYKIVMSIEPILRPSGFILLRGREFIEQRSAAKDISTALTQTPMLNKSNIALFSHVMDTMNMGVYMTDPKGNIIYANPVLEHWLAFNEGEITSSSLSLQDLFYQGGKRVDHIEPDNYEGEVTMQKKIGGSLKVFINQKILRDNDKVMGCTAIVHNITDQAGDAKNKLW